MRERRVREGGFSAVPGRLRPGLVVLCLLLFALQATVASGKPKGGRGTNPGNQDRGHRNRPEGTPPVNVPRPETKVLSIVADSKSTDDLLSFIARATDAPSEAVICPDGLQLLQKDSSRVNWPVRIVSQVNPAEITFQLDRPSEAGPKLDVVTLDLCKGNNRLIYRGNLPKVIPRVSRLINVDLVEAVGSDSTLVLKISDWPGKPAQILEAGVIEGPKKISRLKVGGKVSFHPQGSYYTAKIPFSCSAGEIQLPKLFLSARDDEGIYSFKSDREFVLCRTRPDMDLLLWAIPGVLLALAALAYSVYAGRENIRGWVSRSKKFVSAPAESPPPPAPSSESIPLTESFRDFFPRGWNVGLAAILHAQLDPLYSLMQEVNAVLRQVLNNQIHLPASTSEFAQSYGTGGGEKPREPYASSQAFQPEPVKALTDLINRWWEDGSDRDSLVGLIRQDPSIKSYRPSNIQDSLKSTTNRTFLFQPSGGPVEWLGRVQQSDLFLVPGDPKFFQTGDSLKFLGVLFEGLGSSLSNIRFRRVVKACRLKKEAGSPDRYRVIDRGILELEGQTPSKAPAWAGVTQPVPVAQPILPQQDLAGIVQLAVRQAVPNGLQTQIQDLTQQIRILTESGSKSKSGSQNTNVDFAAAIGAVSQDLSLLGQRINAIEKLAHNVESLRESLTRIEGELRNISSRPPLPAPIAAASPLPPSSKPLGRSLRPEDQLEEIRKGVKDASPAAVSPVYSQPPAPFDSSNAPEQLWTRLQKWWPKALQGRIPDGYSAMEPSAVYLWRLDELKNALATAMRGRGWQIDMVHIKVPDKSPAGEQTLQIHEPISREERRVVCRCAPASSFTDSLLFQFALRIREAQAQDIAVVPAPGLRLTGSTEGYARLAGGMLPESGTSLMEILRPAILRQSDADDLYTVTFSLQANFR